MSWNNTLNISKKIYLDTDFWNDCLIENEKQNKHILNKKKKYITSYQSISSTEMNSPNSIINSLFTPNKKTNYIFDNKIRKQTNLKRTKSQKSIENLCKMYEKWKISRIKFKEKKERIRKEIKKKEMKECTWNPKLISKYNNNYNHYDNKYYNKLYNGNLIKKQEKNINNSNNEEITFKPFINENVNLKNIFYNGININQDFSNYSFFYRLEKARSNEKEKENAFKVKNLPKCRMKKNRMKTLKEKEFKRKFHKILFEINLQIDSNNTNTNNDKKKFIY